MSYARGEADVIAAFADGHSYSKNKMDEILRSGALDKLPPRQKESHPHVKREDVELIVHELEIPKSQAEKALNEVGGDVSKALKALVTPKKSFGTGKPSRS
ncbi:hypothetical protein BDM02DRAFT_3123487 [Thelephora ganbajun]|uniref:Uncharacterized protein n=1 Tax=Thelephora ganbajun TaxID=370292 RepID=A0ACB6Z130_THEGA|nr:hypothetical protein BDM02DRAFT_3123487 [Thelephora ganbajun]